MSEAFRVKLAVEINALDIPSVRALSEDEYRNYIQDESFHVDPNGVLRVTTTGQPVATTLEQLAVLMDELTKLKERMFAE